MSNTAKQVIDKAAFKAGIKILGVDLTSAQYTDFIDSLNDMMSELDIDGYRFGYTVISAQTETVTVPDYALSFVKTRLALKLCSDNRIEPSVILVGEAEASSKIIERFRSKEKLPVSFPDTLPMGGSDRSSCLFAEDLYQDAAVDSSGDYVIDEQGFVVTMDDETEEVNG